jgi:hypothetical protein
VIVAVELVLLVLLLESLVVLESTVSLLALEVAESLVVPVLLLVALESTVVPVHDWIIASACDSVETIDVALAILKVTELMEEEMVLEVVYYYLFAF